MNELPVVYNSTMLETFRTCPMKFKLSFVDGWAPIRESIHLIAGKAFASGLEAARKEILDCNNRGEEPCIEDVTSIGLQALFTAFKDIDVEIGEKKRPSRMAEALESSIAFWWEEEPPIEIEPLLSKQITINGQSITFCGRPDMLLRSRHNPENPIIVDDKTTGGYFSQNWVQRWELRGQFTAYSWLIYGEEGPTSTVQVRGTSITASSISHMSAYTSRAAWQRSQWVAQMEITIKQIQESHASNQWLMTLGDACTSYGGCRFRNVCKRFKGVEEIELSGDFTRKLWDPLTRDQFTLGVLKNDNAE